MDTTKDNQIEMDFTDSITISLSDVTAADYTLTLDPNFGAIPNNGILTTGINYPNVTIAPSWTGTGTSGSWTIDESAITSPASGKIRLEGEHADIEVNGRSVMQILDSIEQRLGLLKCREDLETEWEELRALGDQYRALVRNIEEKNKMWDTLKKMPPPEIS